MRRCSGRKKCEVRVGEADKLSGQGLGTSGAGGQMQAHTRAADGGNLGRQAQRGVVVLQRGRPRAESRHTGVGIGVGVGAGLQKAEGSDDLWLNLGQVRCAHGPTGCGRCGSCSLLVFFHIQVMAPGRSLREMLAANDGSTAKMPEREQKRLPSPKLSCAG